MNNLKEMERWLKDANASFESASRNFKAKDYRVAIQQAQLCIELSTKAIISYFEEPRWVHNPAEQLRSVVLLRKEKLAGEWSQKIVDSLLKIAEYAQKSAPWHGWSVYGKESEDGDWIPAVELCDKKTSNLLFSMAKESLKVVKSLLSQIVLYLNDGNTLAILK